MNRIIALFTIVLLVNLYSQSLRAQSTASSNLRAAIRPRAAEGDTVWVFVNHIKPDKRQQFEHFVHDLFWPMASQLGKSDQQVFGQTRVLYPIKAEADGTYSYLFIMDPVITGGNYDIKSLLTKMYGPEKATEYNKMYDETAAREQTGYTLIQSHY